jgi:hypothetical protein
VQQAVLIAIFGWMLADAQPAHSNPPRFEDFAISAVYHGLVKPPDFGDTVRFEGTDVRCFADPVFPTSRDVYAGMQVNFAGHFVISTCTCGSGCHYLYMWDAISGKFYQRLPPGVIDVGPYTGRDAEPREITYRGERYQVNSSLLIVEGCVEDTCDCANRYYRWTGSRFELVFRGSVRMPEACLRK